MPNGLVTVLRKKCEVTLSFTKGVLWITVYEYNMRTVPLEYILCAVNKILNKTKRYGFTSPVQCHN